MADPPAPTPPALDGTSWVLAAFADAGAWEPAVAEAVLTFGPADRLHASTGCNQVTGRYHLDGDRLTVDAGAMTLAACPDDVRARQEAAVVAGLQEAAGVAVVDGTLEVRAADGTGRLRYERGLTELAGTAWRATGVNNGGGAVVSSDQTSAVTARFDPDGTLSGSTGCNQYRAPYQTPAGAGASGPITIGPAATTRRWCGEEAMALERQLLDALGRVTTYRLTGTRLELRDDAGALQVSFRLEAGDEPPTPGGDG